jgi:hypothetical protein
MLGVNRIWGVGVGVCLLPARMAFAQAPGAPAAPPAAAAPAPPVAVNHADNVIVAESGSQVTVHPKDDDDEFAPDPARKAALIASSIFFGLGISVTGIGYLVAKAEQNCSNTSDASNGTQITSSCTSGNGVPELVIYDTIMTGAPSTARWVVGDVNGALIFSALRGASVITASVVSWGSDNSSWLGPFFLGFLAPVTLAIVDMATTPHREQLAPHDPAARPQASRGFMITGLSPAPTTDAQNRFTGATLHLSAQF